MQKSVLNNKIHDFEITRKKRDANFEMGDYHYHPYYEIYYVVSGNCNLLFNHSIYHINQGDFSRKFKQITGFCFKEYLYGLRFKEAQNLLLNSRLSVTEIALSCGFSDGNYFGDAFRKEYGLSPLQYRKSK